MFRRGLVANVDSDRVCRLGRILAPQGRAGCMGRAGFGRIKLRFL